MDLRREMKLKVAQEVFDDNDENDIRYDVHVPGDGWGDVRGKDTDGAADEELSDDCLKTDILGNELRVNKMRSVFCVSCAHLHIVILVQLLLLGYCQTEFVWWTNSKTVSV